MTYISDWTRPEAYLGRVPRSRWRRLLARLDRWLARREAQAAWRAARRAERQLRSHAHELPAYLKRDIGLL